MGENFRDTDEYDSFTKGLTWVMRQQTWDGGWPNAPGHGPVTEVTGHVLNVLAEMGCTDSDDVNRAFRWFGEFHIQREKTIRWGWDIMYREEDLWAATMLCATTMLRLKSDLPIKRELLIRTIDYELNQLSINPKIVPRLSCWVFLAAANAIDVMDAQLQVELREVLWHQIKRWQTKCTWSTAQGEKLKETAQVALALLRYPDRNDEQNNALHSAIHFLVKSAQITQSSATWCEQKLDSIVGFRREPRFFSTRWCVLALEEALKCGITFERQKNIISGTIQWLMSIQKSDGRWQVPEDVPPGPSFCSYALLSIFKWLHVIYGADQNELRQTVLSELRKIEKQVHKNDFLPDYLGWSLNERIKIQYPHPIAVSYRSVLDATDNIDKLSHLSNLCRVFVKYCASVLMAFYCCKIPPSDREAKISDRIIGKLKGTEPEDELELIGQLATILSNNNDDINLIRNIFSAYHTNVKPNNRIIDCYLWLSGDLLKTEILQAVKGRTALMNLLSALLVYFDKEPWKNGNIDDGKVERHVLCIKAALDEVLEVFPLFTRYSVGIATDIRVIQEQGQDVFEHSIKLVSGTDYYYTRFKWPSKAMDLKRLYLFQNKNGKWNPWFCLHPFVVFMRCEKCNQETFYFLDRFLEDRTERERKKVIYSNYSCGCPSKPEKSVQEIFELLENLRCLSQSEKLYGEELYRIKLRKRLTSAEKFEGALIDAPDLLFLMDSFDISRQRAKELEAEVGQKLRTLQAEEIDHKALKTFQQIVDTMRDKDGILTDKIKAHLVEIGKERGLPRRKVFEIIGDNFGSCRGVFE